MLQRWLIGSLWLVCTWLAVVSCKGTPDTLCTPGENIFCKCRGGAEGTKTCQPDGQSFDSCVSDTGSCTEVPPPTSTTTSKGATSATTGTGAGGGAPGDLAIFSPCNDNSECKSGECKNHYCTLDCGNYKECVDESGTIVGDCVRFALGTIQICSPYCQAQADCSQFGPQSACGGAKALDDPSITFAVCGDWGSELGPIPLGASCNGDPSCTLGLTGYEEVCIFNQCAKGCFVQADCPTNKTCSSGGATPGTCG